VYSLKRRLLLPQDERREERFRTLYVIRLASKACIHIGDLQFPNLTHWITDQSDVLTAECAREGRKVECTGIACVKVGLIDEKTSPGFRIGKIVLKRLEQDVHQVGSALW